MSGGAVQRPLVVCEAVAASRNPAIATCILFGLSLRPFGIRFIGLVSPTIDRFVHVRQRLSTMLQVISPLKGFGIEASDGPIGTLVDLLFDDRSWKVRWLVVDTGGWLKDRKVLIHPSAISHVGLNYQQFEVKLTKAQVQGSPSFSEHQPVSKQMQAKLYEHYDWDPRWGGPYIGVVMGAMASPPMEPPYLGFQTGGERSYEVEESQEGDPHLAVSSR